MESNEVKINENKIKNKLKEDEDEDEDENEDEDKCVNNNMKKKNILPWIEKYRPVSVENILYNEKIINCINKFIDRKELPNMIFCGPPGTGKTSLITSIAKKYYGDNFNMMTLIINASEERGIETVRNTITQFCSKKSFKEDNQILPFKLVILDEIDSMTCEAQSILRKVVSEFTRTVRFCFMFNVNNRIDPGIISQCTTFIFKPFNENCLKDFIENISKKENMILSNKSTDLIIKKSNGDLRKLLNILQSIKMYVSNKNKLHKKIKESIVSEVLCSPLSQTINEIINFFQKNSLNDSIEYFNSIIKNDIIPLSEFIDSIFVVIKDRVIKDNTQIINYSIKKCANITRNLNQVNNNLTNCDSEDFQIPAFVACFYL